MGLICISMLVIVLASAERSDGAYYKLMESSEGMTSSLGRARRSSHSSNISVSLNLTSLSDEDAGGVCYNGNTAGLGKTTLRLEYRTQSSSVMEWTGLKGWGDISLDSGAVQFSIPVSATSNPSLSDHCIQFRLVQEEHGGGYCNCWSAHNIKMEAMKIRTYNGSIQMCINSASVRRILTCTYCNNTSDNSNLCTNMTDSDPPLRTPFNISAYSSLNGTLSDSCSEATPRLHIFFRVIFRTGYDLVERLLEEGVEFAMRFDNETWIPLTFIYSNGDVMNFMKPNISIGAADNLVIRDYRVKNPIIQSMRANVNVSLEVCNFKVNPTSIQFRWLQTSWVNGDNSHMTRDIWGLDDLKVSCFKQDEMENVLLSDSFDEELNSNDWPIEGRRDVNVSTMCTIESQALAFGLNSQYYGAPAIFSRSIRTAEIAIPTTLICLVMAIINSNPELTAVANANTQDSVLATELLNNITARARPPEPAVTLYLLGNILDMAKLSEYQETFVENFLGTGENIIASTQYTQSLLEGPEVIGSTLLSILDRLALTVFDKSGNISTGNISIRTMLVSSDLENENVTNINSKAITINLPPHTIQLPPELLRMFVNSSLYSGRIRVISALYRNVENLFPSGRPGIENSSLGSDIISTSLQCGDVFCDTQSIQLQSPVIITIQHSVIIDKNVDCVFWEFLDERSEGIFTRGQWSNDNCSKNTVLSNASMTVCECTHLTHFAILLSPVPLDDLPDSVTLSLEVISFVGVAISLVAMAITIMTFTFLRSLHDMRNYIHINLCINLMIAQLIFIVGIDRSADDHVPVHCQAIAVLLHYFFLVSFMWMLMEGVVLYIVLVFVFVEKTMYYMIGFTIASYGIPLLYMGLTLPLGFALNNQHYYGSKFNCFLNSETHFIWAFIAPVIVIILINFVLLLIVARVMWKHQKRRTDKSKADNVKRWLRSAVFLVIVMGLTWIIGVLVLEVEALLPLTYIFTIMVACQGLLIFLIFVVFSKQVRNAYKELVKAKLAESTFFSRVHGDSCSNDSNLKKSRK